MLGCLGKAHFKRGGCDTFAKIIKLEITVVIKYFCKKGMPPKEINEDVMETLGKESPSNSTVKYWQQSLRGGEDNGRSGRNKDATAHQNVKVVHTLAMCDRKRDLRSIASEVGIRLGAVKFILTNILGMSKVLAGWVPRMLTDDQKRTQLDISRYFLSRYEDDPCNFIERVVTQDVTWLHHFVP